MAVPSDRVRIVKNEVNNDIKKIKEARGKLQESLLKIQELKKNAMGMKGKTGVSIVNQCQSMEGRIRAMDESLSSTIITINKIIAWYDEHDAALARKYKNIFN